MQRNALPRVTPSRPRGAVYVLLSLMTAAATASPAIVLGQRFSPFARFKAYFSRSVSPPKTPKTRTGAVLPYVPQQHTDSVGDQPLLCLQNSFHILTVILKCRQQIPAVQVHNSTLPFDRESPLGRKPWRSSCTAVASRSRWYQLHLFAFSSSLL